MFLPEIPMPVELSDEQHRDIATQKYNAVEPYMIHAWPEAVRALSFETKLIEIDSDEFAILFDYQNENWKSVANSIAEKLDAEMDWDEYFIRLSSRSPKDVTDRPITCSGKQAVHWLSLSERCLDDTWIAQKAGKPTYIALRKAERLWKDAEFRCFAKDGQFLGLSRYFYREEPEHKCAPNDMFEAAKAFYEKHLAAHYPTVVFDMHAPGSDFERLIEINPYGMSDPCLFGNYEEVEKGGVRM